jgi:hypothetical protein
MGDSPGDLRARRVRALGLFLFAIGALVGLGLSAVAIWGDLEATLFDRNMELLSDASLKGLRCPVLLTSDESGTVSATIRNSLDRPAEFRVRIHVSRYLTLLRESDSWVSLAPGEQRKLEWTVTSDDVVYDRLILVKVLQFPRYPLPSRLGSCGIVVVDLPILSGSQVLALALAASLLGMAAGIGSWLAVTRPLHGRELEAMRAMVVLACCVGASLVAGLLGLWGLGIAAVVAIILLIGAIGQHFVSRPARRG